MPSSERVLIETLWNVKESINFLFIISSIVLIETLWTVKEFAAWNDDFVLLVLLETLWTVKCNRILTALTVMFTF